MIITKENIEQILRDYREHTENAKKEKKIADTLKDAIMAYMGNEKTIVTDNLVAILTEKESIRLDNDALYKEFGRDQTLEMFGKVSISHSVTVTENVRNEKKTA